MSWLFTLGFKAAELALGAIGNAAEEQGAPAVAAYFKTQALGVEALEKGLAADPATALKVELAFTMGIISLVALGPALTEAGAVELLAGQFSKLTLGYMPLSVAKVAAQALVDRMIQEYGESLFDDAVEVIDSITTYLGINLSLTNVPPTNHQLSCTITPNQVSDASNLVVLTRLAGNNVQQLFLSSPVEGGPRNSLSVAVNGKNLLTLDHGAWSSVTYNGPTLQAFLAGAPDDNKPPQPGSPQSGDVLTISTATGVASLQSADGSNLLSVSGSSAFDVGGTNGTASLQIDNAGRTATPLVSETVTESADGWASFTDADGNVYAAGPSAVLAGGNVVVSGNEINSYGSDEQILNKTSNVVLTKNAVGVVDVSYFDEQDYSLVTVDEPLADTESFYYSAYLYGGTFLSAVNNNGLVAGNFLNTNESNYWRSTFKYSDGNFSVYNDEAALNAISQTPNPDSVVEGISDNGEIVVTFNDGDAYDCALYNGKTAVDIGVLLGAIGSNSAVGVDITDNGEVYGWYGTPLDEAAFLYSDGKASFTDWVPETNEDGGGLGYASFSGISSDGKLSFWANSTLTGDYISQFEDHGGPSTFIPLKSLCPSYLQPYYVYANAINDNGAIAGTVESKQQTPLPDDGGFYQPNGPDDRKFIYTETYGFVFDDGMFSIIQFPDALQTAVTGINDSGEIVGYYVDQSGVTHGFIGNPNGSPVNTESSTFQVSGSGLINLSQSQLLTGVNALELQEGQAAYNSGGVNIPGTEQTVDLPNGVNLTVDVAPDTSPNPKNPNAPGIIIICDDNSDTINLGAGADIVTLGSALQTVNGGAEDIIDVTGSTIGATILNGGHSALFVSGGGTATMSSSTAGISTVALEAAPHGANQPQYEFTANATSGLIIDGSGEDDTITVGSASQTVNTGNGDVTIVASAANAGVLIDGGAGVDGLVITGGGMAVLNPKDTLLSTVRVQVATSLTLSDQANLLAVGSSQADTIIAQAPGQTLTGNGGADTLVGSLQQGETGDLFRDSAGDLSTTTIKNFLSLDQIDITDHAFNDTTQASYKSTGFDTGIVTVSDSNGTIATIDVDGEVSSFSTLSDGAGGILVESSSRPNVGLLAQYAASLSGPPEFAFGALRSNRSESLTSFWLASPRLTVGAHIQLA